MGKPALAIACYLTGEVISQACRFCKSCSAVRGIMAATQSSSCPELAQAFCFKFGPISLTSTSELFSLTHDLLGTLI